MKNIHIIPTEKPSRLFKVSGELKLTRNFDFYNGSEYQNIYITSDEEIKEGDWYFITESISKCESKYEANDLTDICKKIILTTDQDLIADGVQAIDDEFLEWFVKNPSCEKVEVEHFGTCCGNQSITQCINCKKYNPIYKITIPQEEPKHSKVFSENGNQLLFDKQGNLIKEEHNPFELPEVLPDVMFYESLQETKQETLEEVVRKYPLINQRIGFKNGAKTFEENMIEIMDSYADDVMGGSTLRAKEWFEQFKKK
jgi:hypothetical protein